MEISIIIGIAIITGIAICAISSAIIDSIGIYVETDPIFNKWLFTQSTSK